jgi:hypothetical protein
LVVATEVLETGGRRAKAVVVVVGMAEVEVGVVVVAVGGVATRDTNNIYELVV